MGKVFTKKIWPLSKSKVTVLLLILGVISVFASTQLPFVIWHSKYKKTDFFGEPTELTLTKDGFSDQEIPWGPVTFKAQALYMANCYAQETEKSRLKTLEYYVPLFPPEDTTYEHVAAVLSIERYAGFFVKHDLSDEQERIETEISEKAFRPHYLRLKIEGYHMPKQWMISNRSEHFGLCRSHLSNEFEIDMTPTIIQQDNPFTQWELIDHYIRASFPHRNSNFVNAALHAVLKTC